MSQLDYQAPRPPLPFADRSAFLLTSGILLVLSAAGSGCITLLMPLALMMPQQTGQPAPPVSQLVVSMLIYLALTVVLAWLGIGAMLKRRWSRALSLILATHWTIVGVATLVVMLALLPLINEQMQAPGAPAGLNVVVFISTALFLGVFMIALPLAIVLMMRPQSTRLTCEHYDPIPRWTDRCSLPVLGAALTLVLSGLLLLTALQQSVFGLFGVLLTGVPAALMLVATAAVLVLAGYRVYLGDVRGIWLGIAAVSLLTISTAITTAVVPASEYLRAVTSDSNVIAQIEEHASLYRGASLAAVAVFGVGLVAYLLQMRKHLAGPTPARPV